MLRLEKLVDVNTAASRRFELTDEIIKQDPSLPFATALTMAGDRLSAKLADAMLEDGIDFKSARVIVGSYALLDWVVRTMDRGVVSREHVLDNLPDWWRGSDPDDTDPRFLALWRAAWERNGKRPVCDDKPFPRHPRTVYRGQDADAPIGIAWTLDLSVAKAFANGRGLRQSGRPGVVFGGVVSPKNVLGYLTRRHEAEVVIDPTNVRHRIVGHWEVRT